MTPAEQEVYRVEAESKAAGFDTSDIAKAVLMRQLMADIVLMEPAYQVVNQSMAEKLGAGAWDEVIELLYGSENVDPTIEFMKVLELLQGIKKETWTKFLHLDQVIPIFESLSPQAWEMAKGQMRAVMDVNPADFLPQVHCPVLTIFGEDDTSVPVEKSVTLYKQYLSEAGNEDVMIKVFPKASHTIQVDHEYASGYFELMQNWLNNLPIK